MPCQQTDLDFVRPKWARHRHGGIVHWLVIPGRANVKRPEGKHITVRHTLSVTELLDRYGQTYADQAGITLRDTPSPLYRLLVLTTLLSARITADIAVAAAGELFRAGWRTPARMAESAWQDRVDALGRARYVRYDESTSTSLAESARRLPGRYHGDLRALRAEADGDPAVVRRGITGFPRIGATGAHIFCREVQVVWPELRPYFGDRALHAAGSLGLPTDPARLASRVDPADVGRLAAALIRHGLDQRRRSAS